MKEFSHVPVMPDEVISALNIKENGIYMDGTLGGAGHSRLIASRLSESGRLYCFDRDEEAIEAGSAVLKDFGSSVEIIHDNFKNAVGDLKAVGVGGLDGCLLDLGVSSHQLDDPDRGFSYMQDAPLDMRMDQTKGMTASDLVNGLSEEELTEIFRDYGEEKFAHRIAAEITRRREEKKITTTFELNNIIYSSVPKKARIKGSHPSKRIFQALRIACNEELSGLGDCLNEIIDFLNPGGVLAVITFHSLEDRIVKKCFMTNENPCICPPSFPVCTCGRRSKGHCTPRKPVLPTERELEMNKRSASAKLRVFIKAV